MIKDDVGTLRRLLQLPAPAPDGSRPGIDAISKVRRSRGSLTLYPLHLPGCASFPFVRRHAVLLLPG